MMIDIEILLYLQTSQGLARHFFNDRLDCLTRVCEIILSLFSFQSEEADACYQILRIFHFE